MRTIRLFVDPRSEEKWLNAMIQKGWLCISVNSFGIYSFEKTHDKNFKIRIDFREFESEEKFQNYLQIHEEYGWTFISGSKGSSILYWLHLIDGQEFLYSDKPSERSYYRRISKYYGSSSVVLGLFTFILFKNISNYKNLKSAYFTPGLWEKDGINFFFSFLVETPFALFRYGSHWLVLVCGVLSLIMYLKYKNRANEI